MKKSTAIRTITRDQSDYPRRLLAGDNVPEQLYALGDCPLNAGYMVAVVGTRSATSYALTFINQLVEDLGNRLGKENLVIVSGLAMGCDVMAHKRALELGIPTVALMAHGLDRIYPAAHREIARKMVESGRGMLLTAYPTGTPIHQGNFLARNKIIAGISDCVVVVESAADKGGALHTARYTASLGKKVFALPGRISDRWSRGCNMLIRYGTAQLAENADDIIHAMNWTARKPVEQSLQQELFIPLPDGPAGKVVDFLSVNPDSTADVISGATGLEMSVLLSTLMEMEFSDRILSLPGNRYRLL